MRPSLELKKIIEGKIPLDFNWNCDFYKSSLLHKRIPPEPKASQLKKVIIVDEGLRDGLHGVLDYPSVKKMLRYVKSAYLMKIRVMTIGIYSGDGVVSKTTKKLLWKMKVDFPQISPIVLSMATSESLKWAAECAAINPKLQVLVFMGSAPSRMLVEGWTKDFVFSRLSWAVKKAVNTYKLNVIGATEHTTQTPPGFLKAIIKTQIKNGAKYFCVADTIGIARPIGVYRIIKFVKKVLRDFGADDILIDWHGHRDIGYSTANAMAAVAAGADRIHLVALGIGERAGNSSLEKFLVNASQILRESDSIPRWDMSYLSTLLKVYAEITNNDLPQYGCLGERAFCTSLGIHTAAILKAEQLALEAEKKGHSDLVPQLREMARKVYSAIDPNSVGRDYQIGIGPYSGASTVKLWAISKGFKEPSERTIKKVLNTAKGLRRNLSKKEIFSLINFKK
ncbi:hypothetical protein COT75_04040 [Candidatus Beckwithbacteria bacterium CG10_big_fil_rev_8_21_14_0_10_34_10]|uniref:Pyruvate carboxyltransferase domain-containing protein n=1 Tax=Candidatus Beckwithbacteria bacterium CG10_big_fil_rev_8_21_14_0_10_34_10 TaxID=1974495 RepID=A0A2H0W8M8_9BACT|nr:MAG: hypothetical protein COT75_04040 [Candidatus Beckwithbacteria bacterium CG10_big_fil_rev_8_21_14_0_10_34_10]